MTDLTRLSSRMEGVSESSTLKMNALARELASQGAKVINLTAGEPDYQVPAGIQKAAIEAIESGFSRYTPVPGIPELRSAIAKKLKQENSLDYLPDQVVVSVGAKQAIFNFLLAIINPGDEVIIPSPYWVSYPEMVKLAGGEPVIIQTDPEHEFKLQPEQLKNAITKKTRAFFINSPSNPSGTTYSKEEIKALAKVLENTSVLVLSDEIYEKLILDPQIKAEGYTSFASVSDDAYSRTVTINGFSKAFAMTGWRLGYAAGPKPIISAMAVIQGQSTSGANSVAQKAALKAFDLTDKELKPLIEKFQSRCKKMEEIFSSEKMFSFVRPKGAFYFFLNVEAAIGKMYNHDEVLGGSEDIAYYLLNVAQVVTVPGKSFGAEGYLRLSFAVSDQDVELGSRKIVEAISKLR